MAATYPDQKRITVPFDGHIIGQGVTADTLTRLSSGLDVGSVTDDPVADAQTVISRFKMVSTQDSLEKALNMHAEIDARYGLFSGGGKVEFAQSQSINRQSTYVVASCVVKNALRSGRGYSPNAAARELVRASDREAFRAAFGDRFVDALWTGGEMHVLVRVTSSSTTHQSKLAASLHAEYNGFVAGGSFKAAYDNAMADTSSYSEVEVQSYVVGGKGEQITLPGSRADEIRAMISAFPAQVAQHAVAYEAELLTYEALALPFAPPEQDDDRRRVLEDCLNRKRRYLSMLADIELARSENASLIFSSIPSAEELTALADRLRAVLNALMAHARAIASGTAPPSLFIAADDPPPADLTRRSSTHFGSWWERRDDPVLLQDERDIIREIGSKVSWIINRDVYSAESDLVERASQQVQSLDLVFYPSLQSVESLPLILDASISEFGASFTKLRSFKGLETFSSLTSLSAQDAQLSDLEPVRSLGGLRYLDVSGNSIGDLAPLAGATALERLRCQGNQLVTLDPLRNLPELQSVTVTGGRMSISAGNAEAIPYRFLDNPIDDASALDALPLLANLFTSSDRLTISLVQLTTNKLIVRSEAFRVGKSNRFRLAAPSGVEYLLIVGGLEVQARAGDDRLIVGAIVQEPDTSDHLKNATGDHAPVAVAVFDMADRTVPNSPSDANALVDERVQATVAYAMQLGKTPTLLLTATPLTAGG